MSKKRAAVEVPFLEKALRRSFRLDLEERTVAAVSCCCKFPLNQWLRRRRTCDWKLDFSWAGTIQGPSMD